jgi:hypothetical protein
MIGQSLSNTKRKFRKQLPNSCQDQARSCQFGYKNDGTRSIADQWSQGDRSTGTASDQIPLMATDHVAYRYRASELHASANRRWQQTQPSIPVPTWTREALLQPESGNPAIQVRERGCRCRHRHIDKTGLNHGIARDPVEQGSISGSPFSFLYTAKNQRKVHCRDSSKKKHTILVLL